MEIEDNVRYDEIKDVFAVSVIFHGKNIKHLQLLKSEICDRIYDSKLTEAIWRPHFKLWETLGYLHNPDSLSSMGEPIVRHNKCYERELWWTFFDTFYRW